MESASLGGPAQSDLPRYSTWAACLDDLAEGWTQSVRLNGLLEWPGQVVVAGGGLGCSFYLGGLFRWSVK